MQSVSELRALFQVSQPLSLNVSYNWQKEENMAYYVVCYKYCGPGKEEGNSF